MNKIILASQSRARKLFLTSIGIPFDVIPSNINEKEIRDNNLSVRAEKLARAKAEEVLRKNKGIIIAADTFHDCQGKVLEKPTSNKEAIEILEFISTRRMTCFTGFCYIDQERKIDFSTTVEVVYKFRKLYDSEIRQYVSGFPVTEWAAGYALVEPYMNSFISELNGSYNALAFGMPSELLIPLLEKSGFEPNPPKPSVIV